MGELPDPGPQLTTTVIIYWDAPYDLNENNLLFNELINGKVPIGLITLSNFSLDHT